MSINVKARYVSMNVSRRAIFWQQVISCLTSEAKEIVSNSRSETQLELIVDKINLIHVISGHVVKILMDKEVEMDIIYMFQAMATCEEWIMERALGFAECA